MRRALLSAGLAVGIAAFATRADASPEDLFGFGARSSAMGATGPASAEGYEAVFGAPGLLAETHVKQFTLGTAIARHLLYADGPGVSRSLPTDEMKTLYIGAVLPLPFKGFLEDRITFGIGFLEPAKFLVRGKILYPERFQYPIVAPRVQSLAIILGLGFRIGDRFFVGVGYEALAGVIGQIVIALDATGHTAARSDDQVVATYAPLASMAFDVTDHLRIGATYRGELVGKFVIHIKAQDLGLNLPDFNVAGVAQYDPAQVAAEVRWSSIGRTPGAVPIEREAWRLAVGAIARRWSKYPGQVEATVLENKDFSPPPTDAHDTISPRIGLERSMPLTRLAALRLRVGYMFEPTPLPAQTKATMIDAQRASTTNLLDSNRHVFTAGVGLLFSDEIPLQLDAFAQLHVLTARTHVKDANVPSDAPGYPEVTSKGTIWVLGMTLGVRF